MRKNPTDRAALFSVPICKRLSEPATETAAGLLRFVMSSETPDLAGDIIDQRGLTPAYSPLPAMIDHGSAMDDTVGLWKDLHNEGSRTTGLLDIWPAGTTKAADLVRALHTAGLRLSASIRFLPEDFEPIHAEGKNGKTGEITGFRFLRAKLLECSVVAMPCNPDAMQLVGKRLHAMHRDGLDQLIRLQTDRHRDTLVRAAAADRRARALLLP